MQDILQTLDLSELPCRRKSARAYLSRDLANLNTETATAYFQGDFIESIIDTEFDYPSGESLSQEERLLARELTFLESKLKGYQPRRPVIGCDISDLRIAHIVASIIPMKHERIDN